MRLTPIFHASVTQSGGRLVFPEKEHELRRQWLASLAGNDVEVLVRLPFDQRTREQNAYLHSKPILLLAEHLGYFVPEMKKQLMGDCWGWTTDKRGKRVPVRSSTRRLSVAECWYFIDWVIPWAMVTHDFKIPLPGETDAD